MALQCTVCGTLFQKLFGLHISGFFSIFSTKCNCSIALLGRGTIMELCYFIVRAEYLCSRLRRPGGSHPCRNEYFSKSLAIRLHVLVRPSPTVLQDVIRRILNAKFAQCLSQDTSHCVLQRALAHAPWCTKEIRMGALGWREGGEIWARVGRRS